MGWSSIPGAYSFVDAAQKVLQYRRGVLKYEMVALKNEKYDARLWSVQQIEDGRKIIVLDLIEVRTEEFKAKKLVFWYKTLDESMGPFYYDCPKELLNLADETNAEWRSYIMSERSHRPYVKADVVSLMKGP